MRRHSKGREPVKARRRKTVTRKRQNATKPGRHRLEGKSVQVPEAFNDPEYVYPEFARLGYFRTTLGVPLLRG